MRTSLLLADNMHPILKALIKIVSCATLKWMMMKFEISKSQTKGKNYEMFN